MIEQVPPDDTRGIMSPRAMLRRVDFQRSAAPSELAGLAAHVWFVAWDLPPGEEHRQDVLAHTAVNISVGPAPPAGPDPPPGPYPLRMYVSGVTTGLTTRVLSGSGWNLAVRTTVGGFGAWWDDVASINDVEVPAEELFDADVSPLVDRIAEAGIEEARMLLTGWMIDRLATRSGDTISTAREVARVAAAAEYDRELVRVEELAALAGVSPRTLQRTFLRYAGVSPTRVIRRYRLLDAAEAARDGHHIDWAELAARLGYADQAHLTRDFTGSIGQSPASYLAAQRTRSSGGTAPERGRAI
ncbi:helix-turn-helix domain-containing protein [Brevibacterium daeguense]|uniref:helix-turn-helix domain-containing protein n=1 Tax=Brevibacterium daeguense TaxID=909936 RepID=UPI001F191DA2